MLLGLDYDGTYTLDPDCWDQVIELFKKKEHEVVLVTLRYSPPEDRVPKTRIICTSRMAKEKFCLSIGLKVDVWSDDTPFFINVNHHTYQEKISCLHQP